VTARPVKDRGLSRAVVEAYRALGHFSARPRVVLFLDLAPDMVDVNVHPAKTEVRFREPARVFEGVMRAVRDGLRSESAGALLHKTERRGVFALSWGYSGETQTPLHRAVAHDAAMPPSTGPEELGASALADVTVLGQFRDTYIVAIVDGDLWLFDQHTAHERVRFETIVKRRASQALESQRLLVPVVVELSPSLALLADECATDLAGLGFETEPFGGRSRSVSAVPALLSGKDPNDALIAVLGQLDAAENRRWAIDGRAHRLAASLACHSAVRAGEAVTLPTMRAIVTTLLGAEHQDSCPHGRPTRRRIPREDIARWFDRSGWKRS
jgi:DNA mismatch repair protein MutL